MITLPKIKELAEQSKHMTSVGDAHADERCYWCVDPANRGLQMWWGEDQPYYRFLYLIAKEHHGGLAVEVGTGPAAPGFACLAAGATHSNNPKSWTIGIDGQRHEKALEVPTKYQRCTFVHGISTAPETVQEIADICQREDIKINIMFIDATHNSSWVNAELEAFKHLFSDHVILVFDDIVESSGLIECFDALPGEKLKFPNLHTGNCIGVILSSHDQYASWNPPPPTHELRYHPG